MLLHEPSQFFDISNYALAQTVLKIQTEITKEQSP